MLSAGIPIATQYPSTGASAALKPQCIAPSAASVRVLTADAISSWQDDATTS